MTTVLLIDDDDKLTEPMQFQLKALGFRVVVAGDGRTGLGKAMIDKPDVVVLDIMLPGMDWGEAGRSGSFPCRSSCDGAGQRDRSHFAAGGWRR
jgi:CheY-like chemotaxis protein